MRPPAGRACAYQKRMTQFWTIGPRGRPLLVLSLTFLLLRWAINLYLTHTQKVRTIPDKKSRHVEVWALYCNKKPNKLFHCWSYDCFHPFSYFTSPCSLLFSSLLFPNDTATGDHHTITIPRYRRAQLCLCRILLGSLNPMWWSGDAVFTSVLYQTATFQEVITQTRNNLNNSFQIST